MGCYQSRIERKEIVSRCKARKRYLKQLVKARRSLSASHALYLRSLRATGSAFVHFSTSEAPLHHSAPRPPLSPVPETTWTSTTSSALPPPPASSTWDFWDPFVPPPLCSSDETATTTTGSESTVVVASKDMLEVVKEINEYFMKAADSASHLSSLLEISTSINASFSAHSKGKGGRNRMHSGYECNMNIWKRGFNRQVGIEGDMVGIGNHSSTIERLYAWEKKLFQELKNAESIKVEHERMVEQLKKLEMNKAEYVKTDKAKKEVEKLESRLMVSSQAIESASNEIIKLRETHLYPQLVDLVKGMICMWRTMYESHQVQTHVIQQLKYLNTIPSTEPTSQLHRQSTLQLELGIQQWHQSFCNLVKAQRDYIQPLTGWLRLSLFQFSKDPLARSSYQTEIYNFCEEMHLAIDRIPAEVTSEGIKSLLTAVHGTVVQQADEQKQKKRSESVLKELDKEAGALRVLESKYGPLSVPESRKMNVVAEKRGKVELLKGRAEEEKRKLEKAVSLSRGMAVNNLQMGFSHAFQAMVEFSSVCMEVFESVYNQAKSIGEEEQQEEVTKKLLT